MNKDIWMWDKSKNPHTPHNLKFSGDLPNPKGIAIGVTDPLACFHLFLPHEVYDDILYQTNLYATQEKAKKGDTKPWTPITKPELMAFIGMNIAMGICVYTNTKTVLVNRSNSGSSLVPKCNVS